MATTYGEPNFAIEPLAFRGHPHVRPNFAIIYTIDPVNEAVSKGHRSQTLNT